jgi:PAS domain S-box-containing protein
MNQLWFTLLVASAGFSVLALGLIGSYLILGRSRRNARLEKAEIIRQSERRYGTLFNAVSDIVYVHDLDGRLLDVNRPGAALLGVEPGALTGRNILDILAGRSRRAVAAYLEMLRSGRSEVSGLFPLAGRDGRCVVLEVRSAAGAGEDGALHVQGIARDVTKQLEVERALRKRERELQRLLGRAEAMQASLRELSRELLRVQEEERRKIGRELHDEIGQLLAAITINLQLMRKQPGAHAEALLARQIEEAERLAGDVFTRIRQVLRELRPIALNGAALMPAIGQLLNEFSERTGVRHTLADEAPELESLDDEKKAAIFRVLQESLTNVMKYAGASSVRAALRSEGGRVTLTVADDGAGFSPDAAHGRGRTGGGFGLLGMRERVQLAGGEFRVDSAPGRGTTIHISIPIAAEGAAGTPQRKAVHA